MTKKIKKVEELSSSMEDYLEVINLLIKAKGFALVNDIAIFMKVKKPSVTSALKNLCDKGHIIYEPYGKIELTKEGKEIAINVQAKHDLITKFLYDVLKVDLKTATEDACKMEHVLSYQTIEKLSQFIEQQTTNIKKI